MVLIRYSLLIFLLFIGCTRQPPEHTIVVPTGDYIKLPLSEVNDGGVHFYTYKFEEKNINFLVRTDAKGKLHTHFDACYNCFKYKRGYVVEGSYIVCIACRYKYNLAEEVWDFIGPCAPITFHSTIKGDYLVIKLSRLKKGKKLF